MTAIKDWFRFILPPVKTTPIFFSLSRIVRCRKSTEITRCVESENKYKTISIFINLLIKPFKYIKIKIEFYKRVVPRNVINNQNYHTKYD